MNKFRESNFELLRLVAMFFIVWYHLLLKFIVVEDETPIYKAMFLPLHVSVICFVLISGYFHIKPSVRGVAKLLTPLLVFYLPLTLYELSLNCIGKESLLFFSKSPYWFIRTYLYLFLIAPVLNSFIVTDKRRLTLLFVLGFMACYMGWLMHDQSMVDGKNLVLFMLIYVIGDCLKHYKEEIDKISLPVLCGIYLFLNISLVCLYTAYTNTFISKAIWALSYPYCSPLLIINAVLLFLLFSKLHFISKSINTLASSVFSVYIIHQHHYVLYNLIGPIVMSIYRLHNSPLILILFLGFFSLMIMFVCIMIDKFVETLYNFFIYRLVKDP